MRELNEFDTVDYRGFVSRDEMDRILGSVLAGILVLHPEPRYKVSLPNKLFEYMAAGIPVIASDFPLWRTIIEDAGCGILVDPENIESIAQALLSMARHPEEAEAMGRRGHEAVLRKYRWEHEVPKLIELYSVIGYDSK